MSVTKGNTEDGGKEPSLKELMALIKSQQKKIEELEGKKTEGPVDIAGLIKATVGAMKDFNKVENYNGGYIKAEALDPNDYVKEGVTFFAAGFGYVIVDDLRQGFQVPSIYGRPLIFTHSATKKNFNGKYHEIEMWCSYTSYSTKEVEWLRNHTLYNIKFFENTKAVSMDGNFKAIKLAANMNKLKYNSDAQILSMLQERQIPITSNDTNAWRHILATLITDEQIQREEAGKKKSVIAARQEDLLTVKSKGMNVDDIGF